MTSLMSTLKKSNYSFIQLTYIFITILLCIAVYYNGLNGPFFLDSFKIYQLENANFNLKDLSFSGFGRRIISQFTFALNLAHDQSVNSFNIKSTNLLIHILTSLCVLTLASNLTQLTSLKKQHSLLAIVVFTLWILSPVNMSSVLYAIQRMNQISALFSLLALIFYLKLRLNSNLGHKKNLKSQIYILLTCVSSVLAILSKENAILLLLFFVLIELFFFNENQQDLKKKTLLVVIALSIIIIFLPKGSITSILNYDSRPFSMPERFLTQSRIIWIYLFEIIIPHSSSTGLFQDGFPVSKSLLSPISTAISLTSLTLIIVLSFIFSKKEKVFPIFFGILFFIFGHLLESTIIPLEMFFEHRNYLPSFGIYFALSFTCITILSRFSIKTKIFTFVAYLSLFIVIAFTKSNTYSSAFLAYEKGTQRDYISPRAASNLAQKLFENKQTTEAFQLLNQITRTKPHSALIARLQTSYIKCLISKRFNQKHYDELTSITLKESTIEVSQALGNIVNLINKKQCPTLDKIAFINSLMRISKNLQNHHRSSWHIDYYIANIYLQNNDPKSAVDFLANTFFAGEQKAGHFLIYLAEQSHTIKINPKLQNQLNEIK